MADQSIISRHSSASQNTPATLIDFGTGVQRIIINAFTNDVHVEFNGTANADSFRISATSPVQSVFEFPGSQVRTVSLLGITGASDVYVIGVVT